MESSAVPLPFSATPMQPAQPPTTNALQTSFLSPSHRYWMVRKLFVSDDCGLVRNQPPLPLHFDKYARKTPRSFIHHTVVLHDGIGPAVHDHRVSINAKSI